ncbi:FAD-dependent oxidoreductase, partial [Thermodesulfobacteriota bacterium]
RRIMEWIQAKNVEKAVIVGGGFIGLEMAENLKRRNIRVTIIEMQNQVMPAIDKEMAAFIHDHLEKQDISLLLGSKVAEFKQETDGRLSVILTSGKSTTADLVILCAGVTPRAELAEKAGLALGERGGIKVDLHMATSNANIWAVGDAVQVVEFVTGVPTMVPMAGPANRQGRLAAEVIMGNADMRRAFRGVQATAVFGVLGLTVASTGVSEKFLKSIANETEIGPYEKIYLHPPNHASYYPGAQELSIKLIFSKKDGKILGAQALGLAGAEKRIDVISTLIQKRGTVFDLEEAELCYAPQYGSAKDPANMAGMIASNILRGLGGIAHWKDLSETDALILDVRTPREYAMGHVEGALNIPLEVLRERRNELSRNQEIWTYCYSGQRSYYATRMLYQYGFNIRNLSGGYVTYKAVNPDSSTLSSP